MRIKASRPLHAMVDGLGRARAPWPAATEPDLA